MIVFQWLVAALKSPMDWNICPKRLDLPLFQFASKQLLNYCNWLLSKSIARVPVHLRSGFGDLNSKRNKDCSSFWCSSWKSDKTVFLLQSDANNSCQAANPIFIILKLSTHFLHNRLRHATFMESTLEQNGIIVANDVQTEAIWYKIGAPTSFLPQRRLTTGARRFPRCLNSWIEPGCAHAGMDTEAARSSQLQDLNKFKPWSKIHIYFSQFDIKSPQQELLL